MAQLTPNGGNSGITVAQVLSALQHLGISVSNGDGALPFALATAESSVAEAGNGAAPTSAAPDSGHSAGPTVAAGTAVPPPSPTVPKSEGIKGIKGTISCPHICRVCLAEYKAARAATSSAAASTSASVGGDASTLFAAPDSYYAVVVGRSVGVYKGWATVKPLVTGVSGWVAKRCNTRSDAEEFFEEALDHGLVEEK
ncbi:hypothetical protein FPV67DRAFT_1667888 [Lyophyllum atratum]|nr:hypothetical protein FPV67DRAFT_1679297 [Lyophyllum atratum]KAF8069987.1 hypothetical protein FPV67DRAFT_1667888 [Lyophyllum atratum]